MTSSRLLPDSSTIRGGYGENGERCVHELVASLDVSQPLMSQHLRVLRSANLIVGRRDGKEIRYAIADDHVIHIVRDAIRHAEEARP